jgi:hypothetical protein
MKKLALLILLVFLLSLQCFSAPVAYTYQIAKSFSAPGTSIVPPNTGYIAGTGAAFHQLTWNVIGTLSGCSVRVDSSADGITWNVGDVIAAQTCTSNNTITSTSIIPNYIRIDVTSLTGVGSLVTILDGFVNNPSGATVSLTATSPVVITPSPTTGTGVISCPTCSTSAGAVTSVFGRTGVVTAASNDYTFAQLASKPTTLAGYGITDPIALTTGTLAQFAATTSAQLAGVLSDETGTGLAVFNSSPALIGIPTAPTAAGGTNTTQIATTAFVLANAVASPASPVSSIQFNNSGSFGGNSNLVWNNATGSTVQLPAKGLTIGPTTNIGYLPLQSTPLIYSENTNSDNTGNPRSLFTIPYDFSTYVADPGGSSSVEIFNLNALTAVLSSNTRTYTSELAGLHGEFDHNGTGTIASGGGISGEGFNLGNGTVTTLYGLNSSVGTLNAGNTGPITTENGLLVAVYNQGGGAVTNAYGLHVAGIQGGVGAITNYTALRIEDAAGGGHNVTNPLAIDVAGGDVNLGGTGNVTMHNAILTYNGNSATPAIKFANGSYFNTTGSGATQALTFNANTSDIVTLDVAFGLTALGGGGIGISNSTLGARSVSLSLTAAGVLAVGTGALGSAAGIVNTAGYRIANGAASGNYLRGNGTNFVSNTIQAADLPSGISPILSGTTGSIGGGLLTAGSCASGTATITGATTSMTAIADPNTYPGDGNVWSADVTSANTVTVRVCAIVALTPIASTYNVRVIQ